MINPPTNIPEIDATINHRPLGSSWPKIAIMPAVTAVLICAKDFSLGKIMAIKVKGIANSKFK